MEEVAMSRHLLRAINKLKKMILDLSALVEKDVHRSVKALVSRDSAMAQRVIQSDEKIDEMEVDIEEECLKILALHQPLASDLRYIVSVLKINNDLERIGDLAVNIAETAQFLLTQKKIDPPFDFPGMAERVKDMLRKGLDALVKLNVLRAKNVIKADEAVDEMHRSTYQIVKKRIFEDPENADSYIYFMSVSRYLERIADLVTNIAEDVIYMVDGEIVRHSHDEFGNNG
jgi:phosphate transport system protein